jgi:hypothetical protein
MKLNKWCLFGISLGVFQILFEYLFTSKVNLEPLFIVFDIISTLVTILLFAIFLTILVSFFPLRNLTFREKFKKNLPIVVFVMMFIATIFSVYFKYLKYEKNIELKPIHKL